MGVLDAKEIYEVIIRIPIQIHLGSNLLGHDQRKLLVGHRVKSALTEEGFDSEIVDCKFIETKI